MSAASTRPLVASFIAAKARRFIVDHTSTMAEIAALAAPAEGVRPRT